MQFHVSIMFRHLVTIGSVVIYVAAMFVSLVAHDPFHSHHSGHTSDQTVSHHHGKHANGHHAHHHHHSDDAQHSSSNEPNQQSSDGHDHDCPVCEFLMLKCLEISIAEVESASELIELARTTAVNHHTAFSPYKPPSRAPPVC